MIVDDRYILEIGALIFRCDDAQENDWDSLTFIFDCDDGYVANTGYLFKCEDIIPAIAELSNEPLLIDDKILELRDLIFKKCGESFKQLKLQMERETKKVKIDFEFDNPKRWSITPINMIEMKDELRPDFS